MAQCKYCKIINQSDREYKIRKATKDLKSDFPRCDWHWRFVCSKCDRNLIYHAVSYCPGTGSFMCMRCSPQHKMIKSKFWAWKYYYSIWCETCGKYHPALDWLEYTGRHPWQVDVSALRSKLGLYPVNKLKPWVFLRWASGKYAKPSMAEIEKRWNQGADVWDAGYNKYGDAYRRDLFNPALFPLIGKVKGKKVLDAGCGTGYMSRILAERGARVTGVDLSKRFIEICRQYEKKKPLGIKYYKADLSRMPRIASSQFDLIISIYVLCDVRDYDRAIKEISRVMKKNGRFLMLIEHPCFSWQSGGWVRIPVDSQRNEDMPYIKISDYFRRGTMESSWGKLPILLTFYRPLSDYFHSMKKHGLVVLDLIEPRPRKKAILTRPADWGHEDRIPPVLIIEAKKT